MAYIGNTPISAAFLVDTFSGNGSTVNFTMTVAPANTSSIIVAITGVVQDPSTYAVNGTTLTFSQAPPSGTSNISVRYLGIPASGVATTAYRTVTDITATSGQTTFTIPSYTVGFVDVFRNGVRLAAADYTATTGTTIVLASGATVGDTITTVSFLVSSVLNAIPATTGSVGTALIADNAITTAKIALGAVIPADLAQPLTSGTAQTTTSGTSIDFTGLPSWVRRITVMWNGVSLSGSSPPIIQIGSGSFSTSGYTSVGSFAGAANNAGGAAYTTGFGIPAGNATNLMYGHFVITLLSNNTWVCSAVITSNTAGTYYGFNGGGVSPALGGALDRVRITTVGGTDTFDAGSINILYE